MRTGFDVEMSGVESVGRLYRAAPSGSPRARLVSLAVDRESGRTCMLMGRLHYKDDLADSLPIGKRRAYANDAELVLAVFNARGAQGLDRLEGEFSLAVSDPSGRCLYLLRDPLGSWPLYWAATAGRLLAGTSLLDLARRLGGTQLNLDHVGTYLMWPLPGIEMGREETALKPLRRVPAGRFLRVGAEGCLCTLHQHLWPTPTEDGRLDDETVGLRFRELFQAAVRERVEPGHTAAHLSGGMDSSSVVCVARDFLTGQEEDRPLQTLSLVYRMPSLVGETSYIHMVLDQGGPVAPTYVEGDGLLAFDWFSPGVPEHDEPFRGLDKIATEVRLNQAAVAVGAATLLTGDGAELVAEGQWFWLADLIRKCQWVTALQKAKALGRAFSASPWLMLRRQALEPLMPAWLHGGAGTLWRRGRARWPDVGRTAVPPWVRPRFAADYGLWRKGLDAFASFHKAPYEESACRSVIDCLIGDWSGWHLAAPLGLSISRPFLDPRLIAFSLSLPHRLRLKPGVTKPLLRTSMNGILPEPIRTRLWKRNFNDPYRLGLTRRLGALEAMVQRSPIADLEILDREELLTAMRQAAAGLGKAPSESRINAALALIAWYDQLGPALARSADVPAEVVRWAKGSDTERTGYVHSH
jgi:asparagine synthase (glutamine-hydrolysing)